MGGKTHSDNDKIVQMQKEEAAEQARKEAERQARIQKGLTSIKYAFEGKPVTKAVQHTFNWKGFDPKKTKLPSGFKVIQVDSRTGKAWTPPKPGENQGPAGYEVDASPGHGQGTVGIYPQADPNAAPVTPGFVTNALQGPDGKIYIQGKNFQYTSQDPTGAVTGGFDKKFYDDYYNSIVNYYQPQVTTQYGDAKKEATYRLARAGTLRSSAADDLAADLANQNAVNTASVKNSADTSTGDLRSQVASEKQKATSQLYATEDPTLAADQAATAVRNISLDKPNFSPLADIFRIAAVGMANMKGGAQNFNDYYTQAYSKYATGGGGDSSRGQRNVR